MTCSGCHYGECRRRDHLRSFARAVKNKMIARPLMALFNLMGKVA